MKNCTWIWIVVLAGMNSLSSIAQVDDSFKGLLKNIKQYSNAYSLGDTLTSSNDFWHSKNLIDTIYLTRFKLIDNSATRFKPESLEGYHCRFVGQYAYKNFLLILTYSLRTYAGDGNPMLILSVFTVDGVLLDQLKIDLDGIHDPEIQPESRFSISKDFLLEEDQIVREFRLNKEKAKYVLNGTTAKIRKYRIKDDGRFEAIVKGR